jgi:hypothetical protein
MEEQKYLRDSKGRLVPIELISEIDQARDELVRAIVAKASDLAKLTAAFRREAMDDITAFVSLSAEQYNVKLGGRKGNVTLTSFDGAYRVLIAIDESIAFDERLQAAKALIDECIKEWTVGARSEVRALIDSAFAVDKQGNISTTKVLSLRKLDIKDPKWGRAMQAIQDSITITESKEYIRVYRKDAKGEYKLIDLAA